MKIVLIDNGTTLLEKLRDLIPGDEVVLSQSCEGIVANDYDVLVLSGSSRGPL